jgi:hypothetical protein
MILDHSRIQAGEEREGHGGPLMVARCWAVAAQASVSTTFCSHRKASDEVKAVLYRESCLKSRVAVQKVVLRVDFPEIELARVASQFLFAYWRLDVHQYHMPWTCLHAYLRYKESSLWA